jgi:hypothetical protein
MWRRWLAEATRDEIERVFGLGGHAHRVWIECMA